MIQSPPPPLEPHEYAGLTLFLLLLIGFATALVYIAADN